MGTGAEGLPGPQGRQRHGLLARIFRGRQPKGTEPCAPPGLACCWGPGGLTRKADGLLQPVPHPRGLCGLAKAMRARINNCSMRDVSVMRARG